jgi:hypothetical protein
MYVIFLGVYDIKAFIVTKEFVDLEDKAADKTTLNGPIGGLICRNLTRQFS